MADEYSNLSPGLSSPGSNFFAVTPNDSAELEHVTRKIYIGAAGHVVIDGAKSGTNIALANVPVGEWPIRARRVYATGTTATEIVGIY